MHNSCINSKLQNELFALIYVVPTTQSLHFEFKCKNWWQNGLYKEPLGVSHALK